jgi:hypothetical protein|eukprot:COSAG01_NODE_390_length_17672_cov_8.513287_15_plen_63_part_00
MNGLTENHPVRTLVALIRSPRNLTMFFAAVPVNICVRGRRGFLCLGSQPGDQWHAPPDAVSR